MTSKRVCVMLLKLLLARLDQREVIGVGEEDSLRFILLVPLTILNFGLLSGEKHTG